MAESDKKESCENYILVINCSKCLSSQDFITRKYTKANTSVSSFIVLKYAVLMLFEHAQYLKIS